MSETNSTKYRDLKEGGPAPSTGALEAEIYKILVVCDSSGCAHISHPRWVTKRAGLRDIPGGWRNAYVAKYPDPEYVSISFSLVGEGEVLLIVKKPGVTVWW
jgi:hypothetical protein